MFAIAFDMNVAEIRRSYPKHASAAYLEIERTLGAFGFKRIQDSVTHEGKHLNEPACKLNWKWGRVFAG